MEEIKQRKLKDDEKELILWTPVILGKNFPPVIQRQKLSYTAGTYLNKQDFPRYLANLAGGLILTLPLNGIEEYLAQNLDLRERLTDEQMVRFLDGWIQMKRRTK